MYMKQIKDRAKVYAYRYKPEMKDVAYRSFIAGAEHVLFRLSLHSNTARVMKEIDEYMNRKNKNQQ